MKTYFCFKSIPGFTELYHLIKFYFKFRFDFADPMRHMYTRKQYRKRKGN